MVRGEFSEEQNIFRASHSHFGSVLALLCPTQPISLVVLPDHVRDNRDHTEILKSMLHVMSDTLSVERFYRRHSGACGISEQDAVFYVDCCYAPRFEHP